MDKIKVIQIIDSSNIGGAEYFAINLANELKNNEVESFFCVTRVEGALKDNLQENVPYLFLKRKYLFDINALFKLILYSKKNRINIIHCHTNSFFIGFLLKLFYWKPKLIWHNHTGANVNLKGFKLFVLKFCSLFIDANINVDKDLNEWSKKNLFATKHYFLKNFASFTNINKETYLKGEQGKRIVCVAGLREVKNHLLLLNAFKKLTNNYPDWSLHLVGKSYEDEYSKEVFNFIDNNNLNECVYYYGVKSDIKFILEQSTIGVLSSDFEGLPLALLEYGLAELPVIVTDVGECKHVVHHKESGLVVPKRNEKRFSEAIKYLIDNKEKRNEFGLMLNKNINLNYSKDKCISQIIDIYNN